MSIHRIAAHAIVAALSASTALAHVPFIEHFDYTWSRPFVVEDVELSIACYAWLQSSTDVDYYAFNVTEPGTRIFAEVLVPVTPAYIRFRPSFALIGPRLPPPTEVLPVELEPGYGALVFHDESTHPREWEYEPFGAKAYYAGPRLDMTVDVLGGYTLIYWDPAGRTGDYVAVIGATESFEGPNLVRAVVNTPQIRRDAELHTPLPSLPRRQPIQLKR